MTSVSPSLLETRREAVATADAFLSNVAMPSYSELVQLLQDVARLGLNFDIGRATIRRAYIDEQTALMQRVNLLGLVMPKPREEEDEAPAAAPVEPVATPAPAPGRVEPRAVMLPAQAMPFYNRVQACMQEFEELGGTADYEQDMGDIGDSARLRREPADVMGANRIDDIRHWLQCAREVLSPADSDALHVTVEVDAAYRIVVFLANGLETA